MDASVFNVVVGDLRDGSGRGDAADEEQSGQDHSSLNRYRKVGENGQRKGDQPDADVGLGELEQLRNLAPLTHVVGHDHQNAGQRTHGDVADQRRGEQKNTQQGKRVNHSRNRGLRPGADVRGGASDSAGGGEASEHWGKDIGDALADEFNVGIVAVVAHAVGDHRRHEGLDRAQHGNGEGGTEQSVNQVGAKAGNLQ